MDVRKKFDPIKDYFDTDQYKRIKATALCRSKNTCERLNDENSLCGNKADDVWHLRYAKPYKFVEPIDLLCVCSSCHEKLKSCIVCGKANSIRISEVIKGEKRCKQCQKSNTNINSNTNTNINTNINTNANVNTNSNTNINTNTTHRKRKHTEPEKMDVSPPQPFVYTPQTYEKYEDYLRHPIWLATKSYVMIALARSQCQEMLNGPQEGGVNYIVSTRCKNKCQVVHHIKYCKWGTDSFDSPENLIALCNDCHRERHRCPKCKGEGMVRSEHIKSGQIVCDNCVE